MPSDLPVICQDRSRLLRDFSAAARDYSVCVQEMANLILSGQEVRGAEVRRTCRSALQAVEQARLALYRHEADHCCDRPAEVPKISGV